MSLFDQVDRSGHDVEDRMHDFRDFAAQVVVGSRCCKVAFSHHHQGLGADPRIEPGERHGPSAFQTWQGRHRRFDFVGVEVTPVDDQQIIQPPQYEQATITQETEVAGQIEATAQAFSGAFGGRGYSLKTGGAL